MTHKLTDAQAALAAANVRLAYFVADGFARSPRPPGVRVERADLIGEALAGLCRAAAGWREGESAFSTYAARVIRNQILNAFRARARYRRFGQFLELEGGDDSEDFLPGREPDPADEAGRREFWARVSAAVASLPRAQREAADLVHVAGWRPAEAARLLGVGRRALAMRLLAARGRLREALGG